MTTNEINEENFFSHFFCFDLRFKFHSIALEIFCRPVKSILVHYIISHKIYSFNNSFAVQ